MRVSNLTPGRPGQRNRRLASPRGPALLSAWRGAALPRRESLEHRRRLRGRVRRRMRGPPLDSSGRRTRRHAPDDLASRPERTRRRPIKTRATSERRRASIRSSRTSRHAQSRTRCQCARLRTSGRLSPGTPLTGPQLPTGSVTSEDDSRSPPRCPQLAGPIRVSHGRWRRIARADVKGRGWEVDARDDEYFAVFAPRPGLFGAGHAIQQGIGTTLPDA